MQHSISVTVGLDVGDRKTHYCAMEEGIEEVLGEGVVATTRADLERFFDVSPPLRLVLETKVRTAPEIQPMPTSCAKVRNPFRFFRQS